jgi:hypothetical protein
MAKVPSSSVNAATKPANSGLNGPTESSAGIDQDDSSNTLYSYAWIGIIGYAIMTIIYNAYRIRMGAIDEFGPVIHEFDPYFNYRATEVSSGLHCCRHTSCLSEIRLFYRKFHVRVVSL